jgi:hypothetical protein
MAPEKYNFAELRYLLQKNSIENSSTLRAFCQCSVPKNTKTIIK